MPRGDCLCCAKYSFLFKSFISRSFVVPFLGHVTTHAGVASAGLHGVHTPLPKPSVFLVLAMPRVWKTTLLLGSGWLRLMGACSVGA